MKKNRRFPNIDDIFDSFKTIVEMIDTYFFVETSKPTFLLFRGKRRTNIHSFILHVLVACVNPVTFLVMWMDGFLKWQLTEKLLIHFKWVLTNKEKDYIPLFWVLDKQWLLAGECSEFEYSPEIRHFWWIRELAKMVFLKNWSDSLNSPSFANLVCSDSPDSLTFANLVSSDSPDSRKPSFASNKRIWRVWRI